ncbi:hypothetical protein [Ectobacillus panaciterrae]|uniref:hypothetical protein n=1 Tax=Ectobacillus panaciterrae TaxID=363872 RepID=UPI00041D7E63|nr:hypothetical protein [Ectobacillus panaciterrae]
MKKIGLVFVLLVLGIGAYSIIQFKNAQGSLTSKEEKEIKDKASKVAIDYFKKKKNWDITVTKVEFSTDINREWVIVYGYISGDKNKEVSASISYKNNYEVGHITEYD